MPEKEIKIKATEEHLKMLEEKRLESYAGDDRIISSDEMKEIISKLTPPKAFHSNLRDFDRLTEGFQTGELIVVTGYTGYGKTSFCQTLTANLSDQGNKSLWFSFEVSPSHFFAKLPDNTKAFYMPLSMTGHALPWIRERIIEAKLKYGVSIAFIDHLHFVLDISSNNPSMEIGSIMRQFKRMAIDLNVVIFMISHTKQPSEDRAPCLADLRDSSFIGQESDAVFAVHRMMTEGTRDYNDESIIKILKHRRTGQINKKVRMMYRDKRFFEIEQQLDEAPEHSIPMPEPAKKKVVPKAAHNLRIPGMPKD